MGLIVVEGVDGAGKTSLIDQLRQASIRHFVTLSRSSPPVHLPELTYVLRWMEKGARMPTPLVCDRHPLISEPIYGRVLRGFSLFDEIFADSPNYSGEHFRDYVDRVIYVRPPIDTIYQYVGHHPQLKGVIPNLDRLIAAYDSTMRVLKQYVKVIWYDRTAHPLDIAKLFYGDAT